MKKIHFLTLILAGIAFGCQKNSPLETNNTIHKVADSNLAQGVIPVNIKMNDYAFNPQNYSWKDVDAYYRNEVLIKHQSDSYYNNLRKTTIGLLVNQFDFLQQSDLKNIEFYANELMIIDLPDPDVFMKVMKRLQGHWTSDQISTAVQNQYDRNMKFINEKLKDPQDYLTKFGSKWEALKAFASEIK